MSNDYELPPMPPLPYSGLGLYDYECDGEGGGFGVGYDNDDMERYAREYALLAVQRERERCTEIMRGTLPDGELLREKQRAIRKG